MKHYVYFKHYKLVVFAQLTGVQAKQLYNLNRVESLCEKLKVPTTSLWGLLTEFLFWERVFIPLSKYLKINDLLEEDFYETS